MPIAMERPEQDIQALVRAAQGGDTDSAGMLYDAFFQRIYRYFLYRVSGRETAEDLTQTVFLEMVRALPRYKKQAARFSTWLFQIARHRLIDHYRHRRDTEQLDAAVESGHPLLRVDPSPVTFDARAQAAWKALEQLPDRYRTVVRLAYVEGMETADIAALLGTTSLNVRVLKFRGIQKLKDILHTPSI